MLSKFSSAGVGALAAIAWITSPDCFAADRNIESRVVFVAEISEAMLNTSPRPIGDERQVDEWVLDTKVRGVAKTSGRAWITVHPADEHAELVVHLRGETRSTTHGVNGPAHIHTVGVTRFYATKRVALDEQGLRLSPAKVQVDYYPERQQLSTNRPGLRGRLVRRIGGRRMRESQPAARAVIVERARRQVAGDFDRIAAQQIAGLQALAAQLRANDSQWRLACRSTEDHVLIAAVARGVESDVRPATFTVADDPRYFAVHFHVGCGLPTVQRAYEVVDRLQRWRLKATTFLDEVVFGRGGLGELAIEPLVARRLPLEVGAREGWLSVRFGEPALGPTAVEIATRPTDPEFYMVSDQPEIREATTRTTGTPK